MMTEDDLYAEYARPYVGKLLKLLKLDKAYVQASGDSLWYREDGQGPLIEVLDLLGGYGSTILGHHPPEVSQVLQECLEKKTPMHSQASVRAGAAQLSQKLSELIREETGSKGEWITTLGNSGAEVVEAAIKHALMEWQERKHQFVVGLKQARALILSQARPDLTRAGQIEALVQRIEAAEPVIMAIEGSFHGKTAGSVSVTTNLNFRGMYPSPLCKTVFLKRELTAEELTRTFSELDFVIPGAPMPFSPIVAVLYEPIQGEGGIQLLPEILAKGLREETRRRGIPLIADEIQAGLYRTGRFLASSLLAIRPDYVLLGKSLGGGLCKIGSFSVARERYQEKFGFVHTSTFAEDDLSSLVALKTLEVLRSRAKEIAERAEAFEKKVRARVAEIQARLPGVINEVRGQGFLLGIEFNFKRNAPIPKLLAVIYRGGFATYIYTSYLLNRHQIRVGVTLSKPDTLRLEPSAMITPEHTDRFLTAIEELAKVIHERKFLKLTSHFWRQEFTQAELETVSPIEPQGIEAPPTMRRVAFVGHVVDDANLNSFDPMLPVLKVEERERFQAKFGPVTGPLKILEQVIRGKNGEEVLVSVYGVLMGTPYFEKSLRAGDGVAFKQVEGLFERAVEEGATLVGLGQFTSIVSNNGLLLDCLGTNLTTGNSLTAGFAMEGLKKALAEHKKPLRESRIGVVGASGNICNVLTQLIADQTGALTLVFREPVEKDPKAQAAIEAIITNSNVQRAAIRATTEMADLIDCDAIVLGTNSSRRLLMPEHLKENAVVLDISVPSNVDPRVLTERKDVRCIQGGMAKLPLNQKIESVWFPLTPGDVFACLGETITAGLLGYPTHVSVGPLSKARVLEVMEMAERVGMTLGSLREVQ